MKKAALDPITLKKKGFLGEGFTCTDRPWTMGATVLSQRAKLA